MDLFGPGQEQWSAKNAQAFIRAMQELWEAGVEASLSSRILSLRSMELMIIH